MSQFPSTPVTLGDVLNCLETTPGLTNEARRQLRSAVKQVARMLNIPAAGVTIDIERSEQTVHCRTWWDSQR